MSVVQLAQRIGRRAHARAWQVDAVYTPHNATAYAITLVPGLKRTEVITEQNIVIDRQIQEWICELDQLQRYPERGDTITTGGKVYRVNHPGGSREADYHDPYGESVRIHSIEIGVQSPLVGLIYGTATGDEYGTFTGDSYKGPG